MRPPKLSAATPNTGSHSKCVSPLNKDQAGKIFHTYSSYARGLDMLIGAYNWLDLTPRGRDEAGLKHGMAWVRHHDQYDDAYRVDPKVEYRQPAKAADPAGGCCEHH